jgi:filamentous hemagglutinin family protein
MKNGLACLLVLRIVWGNPQTPSIHTGDVQISEMGNQLQITTSERAVIDWHSFSIAAGEITRFTQPASNSVVLNRVTGTELSHIMGRLEANGIVYLVNPNGVVIGKEGQISAATFMSSTIPLQIEDFLAGKSLHFVGDGLGTFTNLGSIEASQGSVTILSHQMTNEGTITAEKGAVNLLCGHELLLDPTGDHLLFIRPDIASGGVNTQGTIDALQVRIETDGPYGIAIGLGDSENASLIVQENGSIYLCSANGPLKVGGNSSLIAPGGEITLLAEQIDLQNCLLDASHDQGGGNVRIGGDYPAVDSLRPLAQITHIGKTAQIKADALVSGDGGDIVIWSENKTHFAGSISAQALGEVGNGGFAEISSRKNLKIIGKADLRSQFGRTGTLLLDPQDVLITSALPSSGGSFSVCVPPITYTPDPDPSSNVIDTADLDPLLDSCAVTINADTITVASASIAPPTNQNLLTLNATDTVTVMSSSITTPVSMSAGNDIVIDTGSSFLTTNQTDSMTWTAGNNITMADNSSFSATGPVTLTLTAEGYIQTSWTATGVQFTNTYAGATPFTAFNFQANATVPGTYSGIDCTIATITTSRGSVSLTGTGGDTGSNCRGISLTNTSITTATGNISLIGNGGGDAGGTGNIGIYLANYLSDVTSTSGTISLTGVGGAGTTGCIGIQLTNSSILNNLDISGSSTITLNGTGGGSSTGNDGIRTGSFCRIIGTSSGSPSLTGTASGTSQNGIHIAAGSVTAVDGNITFSGSASSGNGILVETTGTTIQTTGSGSLSLTSTTGDVLIGYNGTGGGTAALSTTGTGGIAITSASNLNLIGGAGGENVSVSVTNGAASSDITLLAGVNVSASSNSGGTQTISNAGTGNVTLVADNDFPAVGTGAGQFNLSSTGSITTASGELRIYTVQPSQNTISGTLNGVPFDSSGAQQVYSTYYPDGSYVGPNYTLYYKVSATPPSPPPPPPPPPAPPTVVQTINVALVQPVVEPSQMIQQATTAGQQQPTATPDTKRGCRSPSVAIQAL